MDLLEELWKQDCDLGVSRESYEEILTIHEQKKEQLKLTCEEVLCNEQEEERGGEIYPQLDLHGNYSIDSETGEYLPVLLNVTTGINSSSAGNVAQPALRTGAQYPNIFSENGADEGWEELYLLLNEDKPPIPVNPIAELHSSLAYDYHSQIFTDNSTSCLCPHYDQHQCLRSLLCMDAEPTINREHGSGSLYNPELDFSQNLETSTQDSVFEYNLELDAFNPYNCAVGELAVLDAEPMLSEEDLKKEMTAYEYQPLSGTESVSTLEMSNVANRLNDELSLLESVSVLDSVTLYNDSSNLSFTQMLAPTFDPTEVVLDDPSLSYGVDQNSVGHRSRDVVLGQFEEEEVTDMLSSYASDGSLVQHLLANNLGELLNFNETLREVDASELGLDDEDNINDNNSSDNDSSSDKNSSDNTYTILSSQFLSAALTPREPQHPNYFESTIATNAVAGGLSETVKFLQDVFYSSYENIPSYPSPPSHPSPLLTTSSNDLYPTPPPPLPMGMPTPKTKRGGRAGNHNQLYSTSELSRAEKAAELKREKEEKATRSRDKQRAKALNLPISVDDITDMPIEEFTETLARYTLTEAQHQLVRDIRRRGKNKAAAQNSRKRRLEVIDTLEEEVIELREQRDKLMLSKQNLDSDTAHMKEKFARLEEQLLMSLRDASGKQYNTRDYKLQRTAGGEIILIERNGGRDLGSGSTEGREEEEDDENEDI